MKLRTLRPVPSGGPPREWLIRSVGAALGIGVTVALCALLRLSGPDLPIIVAPLGASAVLLFVVPASPLAQPWPVLGGNVISGLIGVAVYRLVPDAAIAAGLAVGGAIAVMSLLRCLHPPGGAAALTAVIGSPGIHAAGYGFAFVPVGANSVMLLLVAIAFHRLTGGSYPHRPAAKLVADGGARLPTTADGSDLDAALADMHEAFDVSREDLLALFTRMQAHAAGRHSS